MVTGSLPNLVTHRVSSNLPASYPSTSRIGAIDPMPRPPATPKVSTMPRQNNEAAQYLDLYKVAAEKQRLEKELAAIEQRQLQIQQRLQVLEKRAEEMTHTVNSEVQVVKVTEPTPPPPTGNYQTFVLEY